MVARPTEILVVDDEPEIRDILSQVVAYDGNRCTTAADGTSAYTLLRRRPFDIILSDIAMPRMDGLELMVKARELRPETKVILITGYGSTEWAKQAIRRGAFDYLEKPFELTEVRRVVEEARNQLREETKTDASRPRRNGATEPSTVPQRDSLTGLLTHRYFQEELARMRSLCRRQHHPLSVLLIDVDGFGRINEVHGHAVGDLVLRELGCRLQDVCRDSDVLARYGSDQFSMVLPETDADAAMHVGQRCCEQIRKDTFTWDGQALPCTISIGVAECETGFIESETDLLHRAETALVHAKHRGRSRVERWPVNGKQNLRTHESAPGPEPVDVDESSVLEMGNEVRRLHRTLRQTCMESTRALVAAVEAKEPLTERHSLNVATYCGMLARRMDAKPAFIETLQTAAILHDIGKIGIPDAVLNKPGKLTAEEFAVVKHHPAMGVQILEHASFLRAELPMILHHHERWDGLGYPAALAGTDIPLGARILHVADATDAMFSMRSYKGSYSVEKVRAELEAGRGTQFDPEVVDVTLEWLSECADEIIYPEPVSQEANEPVLVGATS